MRKSDMQDTEFKLRVSLTFTILGIALAILCS
jgi:hypothetical protein